LRWFCHRDWQPQALARSDLPQAASGGAKLIGLFALTITACFSLLPHLLSRVHLRLSLQVTAGLEAKLPLHFF
jgi:hypothetical protein